MFLYSTTTKRIDMLKSDGEFSGYYVELSVKVDKNTFEKYLVLDSVQIGGMDYITMNLTAENYKMMEKWFNEYVEEFKGYFELEGMMCKKVMFTDGAERIKKEIKKADGKIHIVTEIA